MRIKGECACMVNFTHLAYITLEGRGGGKEWTYHGKNLRAHPHTLTLFYPSFFFGGGGMYMHTCT